MIREIKNQLSKFFGKNSRQNGINQNLTPNPPQIIDMKKSTNKSLTAILIGLRSPNQYKPSSSIIKDDPQEPPIEPSQQNAHPINPINPPSHQPHPPIKRKYRHKSENYTLITKKDLLK